MTRHILVVLCFFCAINLAMARHYFARVTAVDADKRTITYTLGLGKDKGKQVTATVAKDCVIREGYYRLGKPATLKEGELIVNGLKNFVFKNASAEVPLSVSVFTADEDDAEKKLKKGDVVKILVNPSK